MKKKKRVLIIRCGLLGDTVDATSVIEPLIDYFGKNLEIFWVSRPGICDLFKYEFEGGAEPKSIKHCSRLFLQCLHFIIKFVFRLQYL